MIVALNHIFTYLSVCLTHTGIAAKWPNLGSRKNAAQYPMEFSNVKDLSEIRMGLINGNKNKVW